MRGITVLLVALGSAAAAERRPIAETDLLRFQWIADAQMAPDGSAIVYTCVRVNTKHDGYESSLWLIPSSGGAPRRLTAGPRDTTTRWSPDGRQIAFLRAGEKDPAQIWLLPMQGGEPRPLSEIPKGATEPVWSPDGRTIAFTSTTLAKDFEKKKDGEPETAEVRVILHAAYRSNGRGYTQYDRPAHIWTVPVAEEPQKAKQITAGEFAESGVAWSQDGLHLYFVSNRVREPYFEPPDSDIYGVPAGGGAPARVASIDGPIRDFALDGTRLSFIGALSKPVRSYNQPDLFVAVNGAARNLTAEYDYDIGGGITGDQHPPRGASASGPQWSRGGRFVYTIAAEQGRANLVRIHAETGRIEPVTKGDHDLFAYSLSEDGSRAAAVVSTPTNIGDLYLIDTARGEMKRLTRINEALFNEIELAEPETIWYQSFDGRRIQAWVQRPPRFESGKKYPLILNIHGGPHAAYGFTFDHEFQWMAAKGYIVLYPNPRGSSTYGQDFGNIIQYRYPGDDYKDLMAGVDELIARGWVDPERLGVTGGSGGGVLTNWVIGQTNRFKAAVSQRSIADWRDFWYTADFTMFTPSWFRGAPWEQEADYKARSPITYIEKVTTPLMLIEGEADLRTPPGAGGEQMFRALRYRRIPTAMIQFPGENHELSRSGKPQHRIERLRHIVAWMDKFVLGKDVRTYDLATDGHR